MMQRFSNVGTVEGPDPICGLQAIELCRSTMFDWDGERYSDFLCGRSYLMPSDPIKELIESLREDDADDEPNTSLRLDDEYII